MVQALIVRIDKGICREGSPPMFDDVAAPSQAHARVQERLEKALADERLSARDGYALMQVTGSDLPALLHTASVLRDRHKGYHVSYSRKVFIPLTNICRDRCGYCTFRKDPWEPGAKTMTPDEVLAVAEAGAKLGCKEALFSLGDKPEVLYPEYRTELATIGYRRTLDYLRAACELVVEHTPLLPHANPGLMSYRDLAMLRESNASMGLMLENVSERLLEPGATHDDAPDKRPALRLKTIENAGKLRIPFTTGILIGIGETLEERVDSLLAIRRLHEEHGHIQEVIIQNFRVKPTIPMKDWPEPTLLDMLKTIAVARLLLGGGMNIQAPPNLTPDAYQLLLLAGINDWGGVSPLTIDFINPEAPWPKIRELQRVTAEVGLVLRERLAIYPEYITMYPEYMPVALRDRIMGYVDMEGFVREEA
jgi:7,8-didemethyl-8-hydroxy-5-deazariboflavin synthase CofG subunit